MNRDRWVRDKVQRKNWKNISHIFLSKWKWFQRIVRQLARGTADKIQQSLVNLFQRNRSDFSPGFGRNHASRWRIAAKAAIFLSYFLFNSQQAIVYRINTPATPQ